MVVTEKHAVAIIKFEVKLEVAMPVYTYTFPNARILYYPNRYLEVRYQRQSIGLHLQNRDPQLILDDSITHTLIISGLSYPDSVFKWHVYLDPRTNTAIIRSSRQFARGPYNDPWDPTPPYHALGRLDIPLDVAEKLHEIVLQIANQRPLPAGYTTNSHQKGKAISAIQQSLAQMGPNTTEETLPELSENILSKIGSFITGKSGTLSMQRNALKRNAGVRGGKRKTRRRRSSKKN